MVTNMPSKVYIQSYKQQRSTALTEKGQDEQFSKTLTIAVSFLFFDNLHIHSSFGELFVNVFTVLMLAQFWRPGPFG